jgi:hypothetical protein
MRQSPPLTGSRGPPGVAAGAGLGRHERLRAPSRPHVLAQKPGGKLGTSTREPAWGVGKGGGGRERLVSVSTFKICCRVEWTSAQLCSPVSHASTADPPPHLNHPGSHPMPSCSSSDVLRRKRYGPGGDGD